MQSQFQHVSFINIGGYDFRFLAVREHDSVVSFPDTVYQCHGRLLFLGCDVLAGTQILRNNTNRVHKRLATMGYASRMSLSGFKIVEVNNSSIMWFYSIEGVFRAVFEFGNKQMQKDCLEKLQKPWLDSFSDQPVSATGTLIFKQDAVLSQPVNSEQTAEDCKNQNQHDNIGKNIAEHICSKGATHVLSDNEVSVRAEAYSKTAVQDEHSEEVRVALDALMELGSSLNQFVKPPPNDVSKTAAQLKPGTDLISCFEKFIQVVQGAMTSETKRDVLELLLSAINYLTHFLTLPDDSWTDCSRLIALMNDYLWALQYDAEDSCSADDTFGLSCEHFALLKIVSQWLGNEYRALQTQIEKRTQDFKRQNLLNIGSLPPTEHLIDILYPTCMKILVYNWLSPEPSHMTCNGQEMLDHSYVQALGQSEDMKMKQLQLILELGTNCLVSGVAHVVYSQLRLQS